MFRPNTCVRSSVIINNTFPIYFNKFQMTLSSSSQPRLITHDGSFHADEVLACHMLKLLPEYKNAEIVRSRDPKVWETATVLVDVGSVYDPSSHKYDHHQREFVETFSPQHKTRLSSAGLVYKHFGKRILAMIMNKDEKDADVERVYLKMYDQLIEAFDGIDNGVPRYSRDAVEAYEDATNISSIVAKLNPFWNEKDCVPMTQFNLAMSVVGMHFDRFAKSLATGWLPALQIVRKFVDDRFVVHPSGHIILMTQYAPWKDHLASIEAELKIQSAAITAPLQKGDKVPKGVPLFLVFEDPSGSYRVQCVPLAQGSFENRKPLPEPWRGLRDSALDAVTGVPGGVFIHASGFIGGHQTKEGALKLAEMAIDL